MWDPELFVALDRSCTSQFPLVRALDLKNSGDVYDLNWGHYQVKGEKQSSANIMAPNSRMAGALS